MGEARNSQIEDLSARLGYKFLQIGADAVTLL